jgi:hypothetical protein
VGFITRKAQAEVPSDILGNLLLVSSTEHDRLTHAKNLLLFIFLPWPDVHCVTSNA